MSRYIDADAIIEKKWQAESEACFYALEDVVSVTDIEEAPSIDIVHCGECIHNPWNTDYDYTCIWDDDFANRPQTLNDYCSYGQKGDENVETD